MNNYDYTVNYGSVFVINNRFTSVFDSKALLQPCEGLLLLFLAPGDLFKCLLSFVPIVEDKRPHNTPFFLKEIIFLCHPKQLLTYMEMKNLLVQIKLFYENQSHVLSLIYAEEFC